MKIHNFIKILAILSLILVGVTPAQAGSPPGTWVSGITCQNMSTTNSASIALSFYPQDSGTAVLVYSDPVLIAPGASRLYYTPNSPSGIPSGFLGSVSVASDQPLACAINTQTTGTGTTSAPYRLSTSAGFAEDAVAPKMFAPQVSKRLGEPSVSYSSYLAVQNTTNTATEVKVSYKDRFGTAFPTATETVTIQGLSNKVFYQSDNANLPVGFLGSAVIESTNGTTPLAVMVNFYNDGTNATKAQFQSYSGFSVGASKVFVPRFVRNYYGYQGGLTIQNVSDINITVTITFNFSGNLYNYSSGTISPGASLALYAPNITQLAPVDALPRSSRFGSAEINVVTAGGKIVAIANEDNRGSANGLDFDGFPIPVERIGQGSTYNGAIDGSQTTKILFPQVTANAGGVLSGGVQVSNTTGVQGTCTFEFNGRPAATKTLNLPANGNISIYLPNITGLLTAQTPTFNNSVTVTCTQPVVGIANMGANPGSGRVGDSATTGNGLNINP